MPDAVIFDATTWGYNAETTYLSKPWAADPSDHIPFIDRGLRHVFPGLKRSVRKGIRGLLNGELSSIDGQLVSEFIEHVRIQHMDEAEE